MGYKAYKFDQTFNEQSNQEQIFNETEVNKMIDRVVEVSENKVLSL